MSIYIVTSQNTKQIKKITKLRKNASDVCLFSKQKLQMCKKSMYICIDKSFAVHYFRETKKRGCLLEVLFQKCMIQLSLFLYFNCLIIFFLSFALPKLFANAKHHLKQTVMHEHLHGVINTFWSISMTVNKYMYIIAFYRY